MAPRAVNKNISTKVLPPNLLLKLLFTTNIVLFLHEIKRKTSVKELKD